MSASSREDVIDEVAPAAQTEEVKDNPFEAMETAFKGVYANYKKERAEYNRQQDAQREENFARKQAVIEDLKNLVEKQEDVNSTFPAFRELQNRWREIGPVPATKFRDLNDTYQFYVEKFYDMVKINRDLRDLDFKKNLEAKEEFCQAAERLSENENVVEAFRELQKLHEQWKEFGPVAKEYRDSIWDRFKAATAVINKKYQAYFEGQKEKQQENLAEKTKLCEQVEAIAEKRSQVIKRVERPLNRDRGYSEEVEDHRIRHQKGEPEDLRPLPRRLRQVLLPQEGILHPVQGLDEREYGEEALLIEQAEALERTVRSGRRPQRL